jgi:hypothetical protein
MSLGEILIVILFVISLGSFACGKWIQKFSKAIDEEDIDSK